MPKKHLVVAVDWYGPYWEMKQAREAARADYDHGLYVCIGKCAGERKLSIQYIGIGNTMETRLNERHKKLKLVTRERQVWLGEIATSEPPGRKVKFTKQTLDYTEWLHARFMQLPLNNKKTKNLPPRSITVINRWWKTDYETIHGRPHADWPDLIDYPTFDLPARMVWFGKNQRHFNAPEYAEP